MKGTILAAGIASLVQLFCGSALSATLYVSPSGSDSGSGSSSAPFRTIQKAADVVNPGDVVIVRDGVYTDTDGDGYLVLMNRGGTPDRWITFRAENRWGAVLDGQDNTSGYGWAFGSGSNYIRVEGFEVRGFMWGGFGATPERTMSTSSTTMSTT